MSNRSLIGDAMAARLGKFTGYAQLIHHAMGTCKRLRIAHDGSGCTLVDDWSDFGKPDEFTASRDKLEIPRPIGPLDRAPVDELLESGLLHKYTEHRLGDEKAWRAGWREKGLDGTKADFYCLAQ